jgi:glycosyltransferase involved in cell wall biosynthesis
MLVSLITPTCNRPGWLLKAYQYVSAQTWPDWEWIIVDSSPTPHPQLCNSADARIHYYHQPYETCSIGNKRNQLIALASGDWIVHIDDDDYYPPNYIDTMLAHNQLSRFIKLSHWSLTSAAHALKGEFNIAKRTQPHVALHPSGGLEFIEDFCLTPAMLYGYGFSYVYERQLAKDYLFPDCSWGEDHTWVMDKLLPAGVAPVAIANPQVIHQIHANSSSVAFVNASTLWLTSAAQLNVAIVI